MEPLIDLRLQEWLDKLDEKFASTGTVFDFAWWAVYVALNPALYRSLFHLNTLPTCLASH